MLLYNRQSVLIGFMMVLAGCLAACQSTPPLATSTAPGISVGITADACPNVAVSADQQVTWTNQDTREHIVRHKPAEGNSQFDSGILQPGDSFAFTFPQPGRYTYECSIDGVMTGTI
ncbi:MAG TPA: hypothetical protein VF177_05540, partial [Anaerolineae bacterium]